jgi:hypothetical protein
MLGAPALGFGAALVELTAPVRIRGKPDAMVGAPRSPLGTLLLQGSLSRPLIAKVRAAVPAVASEMPGNGEVRSTPAFTCKACLNDRLRSRRTSTPCLVQRLVLRRGREATGHDYVSQL